MARQHWIITLQWAEGTDLHTRTMDGTVDPTPGATRQDLYQSARQYAADSVGADRDAWVLAWSMDDDDL